MKQYLTLKQAEMFGYGTVNSLKKHIHRKTLKAEKMGTVWIVHVYSLEKLKERLNKRKKDANHSKGTTRTV